MIISSTHDNYNIVAKINVLPGDKLKDNFDRLTQNIDLTRGILNSLMLAVVVTVVQNYFTMMAAYAFSKFQFKGKNFSLFRGAGGYDASGTAWGLSDFTRKFRH